MKLVRASVFLTAALLAGVLTMTAQAQGKKAWSDEDYDKLMKEVGGSVGAMRKAIDGQNAELVKSNAEKMQKLFVDAHEFWTSRNVKDAADTATEASKHAQAVAAAADAKDFVKAAEQAKTLQGTCASCHGKYRDKGPDGSFRIKP